MTRALQCYNSLIPILAAAIIFAISCCDGANSADDAAYDNLPDLMPQTALIDDSAPFRIFDAAATETFRLQKRVLQETSASDLDQFNPYAYLLFLYRKRAKNASAQGGDVAQSDSAPSHTALKKQFLGNFGLLTKHQAMQRRQHQQEQPQRHELPRTMAPQANAFDRQYNNCFFSPVQCTFLKQMPSK